MNYWIRIDDVLFTALEVNPLRVEPYFSLGVIEMERGDTIKACEYYQLAWNNFEKDGSLVRYEKWGSHIKKE